MLIGVRTYETQFSCVIRAKARCTYICMTGDKCFHVDRTPNIKWLNRPCRVFFSRACLSCLLYCCAVPPRADGAPVCWFGRTVIHSKASMTYDQVRWEGGVCDKRRFSRRKKRRDFVCGRGSRRVSVARGDAVLLLQVPACGGYSYVSRRTCVCTVHQLLSRCRR